jgi:hypothetical protein
VQGYENFLEFPNCFCIEKVDQESGTVVGSSEDDLDCYGSSALADGSAVGRSRAAVWSSPWARRGGGGTNVGWRQW